MPQMREDCKADEERILQFLLDSSSGINDEEGSRPTREGY